MYPKMLTYFISLTCSLSHPLPYMDALPTVFGSQYSISSLLPHPQEGCWGYYVIKNLCKVISYILSGIFLGTNFYRAYMIMKRNCSQLRVRNLSSYSLFFFFPLQNPWYQQHLVESMEDLSGFSFSVSFPNGFILESKIHLLNSELPKGEKKCYFFFQDVRDFSNTFFLVFKLLKSSFVWKFQTWHLWYITLSKECMLCLV